MRFRLLSISANRATFAGSAMGRQMLANLISETKPVNEPTVAYLDFEGVDIATGSFLREAIMGFRDFGRNAIGNLYPVIANANAMIEEELSIYLKDRNDAIWACSLSQEGEPSHAHILGKLDAAHELTLELIAQHRFTSAPELAQLRPDEGIGATAWNNRLASLTAKGILMEFKSGKAKVFAPVMETA